MKHGAQKAMARLFFQMPRQAKTHGKTAVRNKHPEGLKRQIFTPLKDTDCQKIAKARKYKALISKYKAHILKYMACIFN